MISFWYIMVWEKVTTLIVMVRHGSEIVLSCGKKQRECSVSMMWQTLELVLTQPASSPVRNWAGELKT